MVTPLYARGFVGVASVLAFILLLSSNIFLFLDLIWIGFVMTLPLKYVHLCCELKIDALLLWLQRQCCMCGEQAMGHLGPEAGALPAHLERDTMATVLHIVIKPNCCQVYSKHQKLKIGHLFPDAGVTSGEMLWLWKGSQAWWGRPSGWTHLLMDVAVAKPPHLDKKFLYVQPNRKLTIYIWLALFQSYLWKLQIFKNYIINAFLW